MKKEKINSVTHIILKACLTCCFICFFGLVSAWSQNGQVPELVDVVTAKKLLSIEIQTLQDDITSIELGGGTVEQNIRDRFQLYKEVNDALNTNSIGLTTYLAVAGSSNYKGLKMDDEAYQDLVNGNWDENMSELIKVLTK